MKILIATPLYPPEIGGPAPYTKELARRLAKKHEVKILTYSLIPEHVENVEIVTVNKQLPKLIRLAKYTKKLLKYSRNADIVYAENGTSVELPIVFLSLLSDKAFVIHLGDKMVLENIKKRFYPKLIYRIVTKKACELIEESPKNRPEISPFSDFPKKEMGEYNDSWSKHINLLLSIFKICIENRKKKSR